MFQNTSAQIKVFSECCPNSSDRIVEIGGDINVVANCFEAIWNLLKTVICVHYFFTLHLYIYICLFACKIMQKGTCKFGWNYKGQTQEVIRFLVVTWIGISAWWDWRILRSCQIGEMSVEQVSHASWKVLDFFLKIPGPGKSWKIILVLGSPRNLSLRSWKVLEKKNIFENHTFFMGSDRNHFLCSCRSQITCSLLLFILWCQYVIFTHSWATKRFWNVLDFFCQ